MGSSSRRWSVSTRGRRYTKHANDAVRYGGVPVITPKRPKESRQRSSRLITFVVADGGGEADVTPSLLGSGGAGVVRRAVGEHIVHVRLGPGFEAAHHLVQ